MAALAPAGSARLAAAQAGKAAFSCGPCRPLVSAALRSAPRPVGLPFHPCGLGAVPGAAFVQRRPTAAVAASKKQYSVALLFDCDGVIVETEELHRRAYNGAFSDFGLTIDGEPVEWSVQYYDILQNTVGGGKPKMKYHFNKYGWPSRRFFPTPVTDEDKNKLVDELQDCKTGHYTRIVEQAAEARPGVLALMDEGLARPDVAMAICSAATKEGFIKVVDSLVGKERLAKFDVILAGDDVTKKKPDPLIYNMARERLGGLPADRCVVIEDSLVGLRAAVGAGMTCIITPTESTASASFCAEGAAAVLTEGLAGDGYQVKIDDIFQVVDGELQPVVHLERSHDECCIPWSYDDDGTN